MRRRVGYARAGKARGSLIIADFEVESVDLTVLPLGAAEAGFEGGEYLSPQKFAQFESEWQIRWLEETHASQTLRAIEDYHRSFRNFGFGAAVSDPQLFESYNNLVNSQLARHGIWVVGPNVADLIGSLASVALSRVPRARHSRRERRQEEAADRLLRDLFWRLGESGYVLAVVDRKQIPDDLWEE